MQKREVFLQWIEITGNVEEKLASILLDNITHMRGGVQQSRPVSLDPFDSIVYSRKSGLSESLAREWDMAGIANHGGWDDKVFPVYRDEDMLSEKAQQVEAKIDSSLMQGVSDKLSNLRILEIEETGDSVAYTEKTYLSNKEVGPGPFYVVMDAPKDITDVEPLLDEAENSKFLVLDYALSYAKLETRTKGEGKYSIYSLTEDGQVQLHAKIEGEQTPLKVCNVHYLTQPVEGAQPIGALSIIR